MKTSESAYLKVIKKLLKSTTADINRLQAANERLTLKLQETKEERDDWKECAEDAMEVLGLSSDSFFDQWVKDDDGEVFDSSADAVRHVLETMRTPAEPDTVDRIEAENAALSRNNAELHEQNAALAESYRTLSATKHAAPPVDRLSADGFCTVAPASEISLQMAGRGLRPCKTPEPLEPPVAIYPEAVSDHIAGPKPKKVRSNNPDATRLTPDAIRDIREAYASGCTIADLSLIKWLRLSDYTPRKWPAFILRNACAGVEQVQPNEAAPTDPARPVSSGESYPAPKSLEKIKGYWGSSREGDVADSVPFANVEGTKSVYTAAEIQEIAAREGWTHK